MSVKIDAPFAFALRIAEDGIVDPNQGGLEKLRDVVAGKDTSFSRSAAMALLMRSDFPNKDKDFVAVLKNQQDPARIRYLAAVMLAKADTRAAQNILVDSLDIPDEHVRAGVLNGLGRIGDLAALKAIEILREDSKPARFAAALISHRLGLEGHELPIPDDNDLLDLSTGAGRPVQWKRPDPSDVKLCLRSLANDSFGIAFSQEPAYDVRCGRRRLMVLFNRELAAADMIRSMSDRKTVAGVVAGRNETNGLYSVSLLILTSPDPEVKGFNLLLHHINGDLAYAGRVKGQANSAEFSLRAVRGAGAFPIQLDGVFQNGEVKIKTALSDLFVQSRRQPSKGLRP